MARLGDISSLALAEGNYEIKITNLEGGVSQTDKPKLTIKGTVLDKDRDVYISRSLAPNAIWKLAQDLVAAGLDAEDDVDVTSTDALIAQLEPMIGKTYLFGVKTSSYNGKQTNEYTLIEPRTEGDRLVLGDVIPF